MKNHKENQKEHTNITITRILKHYLIFKMVTNRNKDKVDLSF